MNFELQVGYSSRFELIYGSQRQFFFLLLFPEGSFLVLYEHSNIVTESQNLKMITNYVEIHQKKCFMSGNLSNGGYYTQYIQIDVCENIESAGTTLGTNSGLEIKFCDDTSCTNWLPVTETFYRGESHTFTKHVSVDARMFFFSI